MHRKLKVCAFYVMCGLIFIVSCDGGQMAEKVTYEKLENIPESAWKAFSEKKIYFGHQSVGFNIIEGIEDLMKEHPKLKLNIVETTNTNDFSDGVLAHTRVGKNRDPQSKIDEFSNLIERGIGDKADIAALKFCYVDISSETDIRKSFNNYKNAIELLKKKYPELIFLHFTAPIETTSWLFNLKIWLKGFFNWGWKYKPIHYLKTISNIWRYDANVKRNEYNDLIRAEYSGKDLLLDIAKFESTYPDGTMETFSNSGQTFFSMVPEYTDDGGHLNKKGRKIIAEQLLLILFRHRTPENSYHLKGKIKENEVN